MIKLYDCTPAPSPRRTRMFLAEKGIEYENIQVETASTRHNTDGKSQCRDMEFSLYVGWPDVSS